MFGIVIFSFSFSIKQHKEFPELATKYANRLDHTSPFVYTVHEPVIFSCSSSPWILRIPQMILKLVHLIKNGLQAFATRFPLEIFTRIITRISWKHRRLIWEKESIRNKPFARVSLGGKNKTAQGLLFLGCMRTDHALVSVHGLQAGVLSIDDSIGN